MTKFKEYLDEMQRLEELLSKDQPAAKWIHDFVNSDNPKFAGKSKKERIKMALGAYYDKQRNEQAETGDAEQIDELSTELLGRYKKKAGEQASAADKAGNFALGNKRFSGIVKATNKQFANDMKKYQKEDTDMCNVCGQTPCNCTYVSEDTELEESAAKFTATVNKAEAAFKKGNEKLGRYHLGNARMTMFGMKTTESPKITANGSYAKYKDLHDRYGHNVSEEVDLEEAEDWELKRIHGEYSHLKSLSTADVHKKHKSMYRVTSSYKPAEVGGKQGMIDDIMHARHGQKRMDAYHALSKKQKDALKEDVTENHDLEKSHIEQSLADKDINAKVEGNKVHVHKDNVSAARSLLKRLGYKHSVHASLKEEAEEVTPIERSQTFKQKSIWNVKNLKKALEVAKQDEPEKAE